MAKRNMRARLLPSSDEVWDRVADFARECLRTNRPVYTVRRRVENRITDVSAGSIGRFSAQGTSNSSRVGKSAVENLWAKLNGEDEYGSYLYFTEALVLAAMPGIVEDMDGELVLRSDPEVLKEKAERTRLAFSDGGGWGGGEGDVHKQIKEIVYKHPDTALAELNSGPYQSVAMEYVLPTGDRIDVVLIDGSGNMLLVEVKPVLIQDDRAPFAQAAKYRLLWHILRDRPMNEIRCLVVAPDISASPWKRMRDAHAVECLSVSLDSGRRKAV